MKRITRYLFKNFYFIRLFITKPRLLLRCMKAAWKMFVFKDYFVSVTILPSLSCNLSCEHCYADSLKDPSRSPMTPDQIEKTLEELYRHGIFQFEFQGGEPLLLKDISRYVKALHPDSSIISITTNGTLLNDENLKMLKSLKVDVIHISLDSLIPEEHDKFRGRRGLFDEVMQGEKLVKKYGFKYTFQVTITHKNLYSDGIQRLFAHAVTNNIPLWLFVAQSSGKWAKSNQILLTEEDIKYLRKLHNENPEIFNRDLWNWFGNYSCPAAKFNVIITPYGDVVPCPFIQVSYGNIIKEDISSIHSRMMKDKYFRDHYDHCLSAENEEFRKQYIEPLGNHDRLPVPIEKINQKN